MTNHSRILLFHIEPLKARQIKTLCCSLKLQVLEIPLENYSQKLGCLAGITGFSRENITYTGAEFSLEMMVFSGMESDLMDTFLNAYKNASIPEVGLKAIITPHNIFWTAEKLYHELCKEHNALHR